MHKIYGLLEWAKYDGNNIFAYLIDLKYLLFSVSLMYV